MARSPRVLHARLPRSHQSIAPGLAGSAVIHAVLILALVWTTRAGRDFVDVIGGSGPAGGGGRRARVQYVQLQPLAAAPARSETQRPVSQLVLPKPKLTTLPRETPVFALPLDHAPVVVASGAGPGTGRGVGRGTGAGAGIGPGDGPGSGRGAGTAFPPEPRQIVLPPDAPESLKGREYQVHLWIDARGRVTKVELEPAIDDAGYRKKFRDRMFQLIFYPARDARGRPVAARYVITVMP